jgi:hypothetical protein
MANFDFGSLISKLNGVKFPSVQVASADANTLDDYAEGTFTPAITFGGAAVGMTFGGQSGRYTKVGRIVFFQIDILLTAKGTSVGLAKITGLPLAASPVYSGVALGFVDALASITGQLMAAVDQSATTIGLVQIISGAISNLTNANFTNTSRITVSGHYST